MKVQRSIALVMAVTGLTLGGMAGASSAAAKPPPPDPSNECAAWATHKTVSATVQEVTVHMTCLHYHWRLNPVNQQRRAGKLVGNVVKECFQAKSCTVTKRFANPSGSQKWEANTVGWYSPNISGTKGGTVPDSGTPFGDSHYAAWNA